MSFTILSKLLSRCLVCKEKKHTGVCNPNKRIVIVEDTSSKEQHTRKCVVCGERTYTDDVMYMCSIKTRFDQDIADSFEYCSKCWNVEKFRRQSMCKRPYRVPGIRPVGGSI